MVNVDENYLLDKIYIFILLCDVFDCKKWDCWFFLYYVDIYNVGLMESILFIWGGGVFLNKWLIILLDGFY